MPTPESNSNPTRREKFWWLGLLAATPLNCIFQIAWFWRFRAHNITMDGIDYIGLARHLVDGNFKASLHGYWSPLTAWIIAAFSVFSRDFTLVGRLVTILSFVACLPLLYWLTWKLWHSRVAAALAMWVFAGDAHALAFLAKAIAMPWLAIATLLAVISRNVRPPRRAVASLLLAFLFPATVWTAWGMALRTKYGVFTTGYQLRQNLMINWHRTLSQHPRGDALAYEDTSATYDDYMVGEVAWSSLQNFSLRNPGLVPMILRSEMQNVPQAVKETVILLTPGRALALAAMV